MLLPHMCYAKFRHSSLYRLGIGYVLEIKKTNDGLCGPTKKFDDFRGQNNVPCGTGCQQVSDVPKKAAKCYQTSRVVSS